MGYVVTLTKGKYQYKISLPSRLIKAMGWGREKVLVLRERGPGILEVTTLKGVTNGKAEDSKVAAVSSHTSGRT